MMFLTLLSVALVANVAGKADVSKAHLKAAKADIFNKIHNSHNSREEFVKSIIPKSFGVQSVEAVEPEPLGIVGRFLDAILPAEQSKGQLIFKFYGPDKHDRICKKRTYQGEKGLGLDTCWKINDASGNIKSIQITASNFMDATTQEDYVVTVFKMFSDKKCQNRDPVSYEGDTKMYPAGCGASPVHQLSLHQPSHMEVHYVKSKSLKLKKIKADNAIVMGFVLN